MFSLNLMRLLRRKKVWKFLTNKLPLKLTKLNRSKPTKMFKTKPYKSSKKLGWPSALSIQPKKFKSRKPYSKAFIHQKYKRPPAVFVDQLFIEPVSVVHPLVGAVEEAKKEKPSSSSERSGNIDREIGQSELSEEDRSFVDNQSMVSADDLWESMVLASPLDGINERADEFIARFRADMQHQEMQAHRL